MREPRFWWRPASAHAALLGPLAAVYGGVAAARLRQSGSDPGIPVLCVGNLTLGGAGKTPTALAMVDWLHAAGLNPFVLTRGYGGQAAGPLGADLTRHTAVAIGDEAMLLARAGPTVVARDRPAGAALARDGGAGCIVMDDGFQNPSLRKTFSLIVVDGRRGIGNGRVFPAGPLRAPLDAQLARTNALLVLGDASGAGPLQTAAMHRGIPVFSGRLQPDRERVAALAGRSVLAFAGIGDPDKFFATLAAAGCPPGATARFADHHIYTAEDARDLLARAARQNLTLVSTEKDLARLSGVTDATLRELAARTSALPVSLLCDNEAGLRNLIVGALRGR